VALINSASFLVATVSHIEVLKYVPANIAYSIIRQNGALAALIVDQDRPLVQISMLSMLSIRTGLVLASGTS